MGLSLDSIPIIRILRYFLFFSKAIFSKSDIYSKPGQVACQAAEIVYIQVSSIQVSSPF